MFTQLKERFVAWRSYRDTVRQLSWLDPHMLADAGIERCEIRSRARPGGPVRQRG